MVIEQEGPPEEVYNEPATVFAAQYMARSNQLPGTLIENAGTRAWSRRFQERHSKKMMPNHMHAGVYSGTLHYLKAVDKVGSPADGRAVVAAMKATPTDDPLYGRGTIREDGRKIHPMYLLQVKAPAESRSEWDVFKVAATIDAEQAFRPLKDGGCPLVAK